MLRRSSLWVLGLNLLWLWGCKPIPASYQSKRTAGTETSKVSSSGDQNPVVSEMGSPSPQTKEEEKPMNNGDTTNNSTNPSPAPLVAYGVSAEGQIVSYKFDPSNGQLRQEQVLGLSGKRPSFLAYSTARRVLYVANEAGGNGGVMAYAVNQNTGGLSYLNEQSSNGDGPTHVAIDRSGRWLMAAHYNSGQVHVYPLMEDGRIGPLSSQVLAGRNAHQVLSAPQGNSIVVPCLGSNYLARYTLTAEGSLQAMSSPPLNLGEGSGPRHIMFHPKGSWAYVVNELNSTIQALRVDPVTQDLSLLGGAQSSLKAPVNGNSGAELQISTDGKYVYSSNRGDDSIAQFRVGEEGSLSLVDTYKTGGSTPRHFSLDPSGRWLLAANQNSGTITVLAIDPQSGALRPTGQTHNLAMAQFIEVYAMTP